MEKTESENTNPKRMGLERKKSISEIKKELGLDKIPVIHKPIPIKKDGKHLYYVAGYFYPLRWQTLERLSIPNQRIIYEVNREEWHREMKEAKERESQKESDPWNELEAF